MKYHIPFYTIVPEDRTILRWKGMDQNMLYIDWIVEQGVKGEWELFGIDEWKVGFFTDDEMIVTLFKLRFIL